MAVVDGKPDAGVTEVHAVGVTGFETRGSRGVDRCSLEVGMDEWHKVFVRAECFLHPSVVAAMVQLSRSINMRL